MDNSSATGQLMFHLFAAFAEFERNLIQDDQQQEGWQRRLDVD